MGHLPALIQDLALILIAGAVVTLLFRKLKQPLVLGYIIAGFLVGPHFEFLPSVVDNDNIETLAEIGVGIEHAAKLAPEAFADPSTGGNPLPMKAEDFERLYRACIAGELGGPT